MSKKSTNNRRLYNINGGARGRADDDILRMDFDPKTNQITSNFYPWRRKWQQTRIGTYGDEYIRAFEAGASEPFNLEDELTAYPLERELDITEASWPMSIVQADELSVIDSRTHREVRKKEMYIAWQTIRIQRNNVIKNTNSINEVKRKLLVEKGEKRKDQDAKLFADILASMDRSSRETIESYVHGVTTEIGDGGGSIESSGKYSVTEARNNGNWYYLFQIAEQTHVRRITNEDPIAQQERQDIEEAKLKSLVHTGGKFTAWQQAVRDQFDSCVAVGKDFSDEQRRIIYMNILNREIFAEMRKDWENPRTRATFPTNYPDLVDEVQREFVRISSRNPALVRRIQERSGGRFESSLNTRDDRSKKDKKRTCDICNKGHDTEKCEWRNTTFSAASNKQFRERMIAKDKYAKPPSAKTITSSTISESKTESIEDGAGASSKWVPTKGTIVRPREKSEESGCVQTLDISEASTEDMSIFESSVQASFYSKNTIVHLPSDEIEFIYDTGTESGTISSRDSSILRDVHREDMLLRGVGGAISRTTEAGYTPFGKARSITRSGERNLISHHEAEKNWQLVHPREGVLVLREWPHKQRTGKEWIFISDKNRFGDVLPRLVIPASELKDFYKSAGEEYTYGVTRNPANFYRPSSVPSRAELTPEQNSSVDRASSMHFELNHLSAQGMLREQQAETYNGTPEERRIGVTKDDVALWKFYEGDYCSGCLQGKMKEHARVPSTKSVEPVIGEAATGDLMFVDQAAGPKTPLFVHVDIASQCIIGVPLADRTESELRRAIGVVLGHHRAYGHNLKQYSFDRESSIVAIESWIVSLGSSGAEVRFGRGRYLSHPLALKSDKGGCLR